MTLASDIVTIDCGDHSARYPGRSVEELPGLVIVKLAGGYTLTHIASGRRLLSLPKPADAPWRFPVLPAFVVEALGCLDWTRSADDLVATHRSAMSGLLAELQAAIDGGGAKALVAVPSEKPARLVRRSRQHRLLEALDDGCTRDECTAVWGSRDTCETLRQVRRKGWVQKRRWKLTAEGARVLHESQRLWGER